MISPATCIQLIKDKAAKLLHGSKYLQGNYDVPIGSYLDVGSPLYSLYKVYLQTTLLSTMENHFSANTQLEQEVVLIITLYPLGMLEFLEDLDRDLMALSLHQPLIHSTLMFPPSAPSTPSASSSPSTTKELMVVECVEAHWTGHDGHATATKSLCYIH